MIRHAVVGYTGVFNPQEIPTKRAISETCDDHLKSGSLIHDCIPGADALPRVPLARALFIDSMQSTRMNHTNLML